MADIICPITVNNHTVTASVSNGASPVIALTVTDASIEIPVAAGQVGPQGPQGPQGIPGSEAQAKSFSVAMAIALG